MQAQRLAPPDMKCVDQFLVQSTVVAAGITDDDITPSMFVKDDSSYVHESKLRVILIRPPNSLNMESNMDNGDEELLKKDVEYKITDVVQAPENHVEHKTMGDDVEELQLVQDIKAMQLKLNELESNLSEAEVTVAKLAEEMRLSAEQRESIKKELALLRSERGMRKTELRFSLPFVCMVAFIWALLRSSIDY